jgi:hypothetical protein
MIETALVAIAALLIALFVGFLLGPTNEVGWDAGPRRD